MYLCITATLIVACSSVSQRLIVEAWEELPLDIQRTLQ